MRLQEYEDLVCVCALAVCAPLAGLLPAEAVLVRVLLAAPLVLALPGYALLAAALFRSPMGSAERATLSLGLSLASAACGGLLLNVTPWGLSGESWVVLLAALTIGASLITACLRATSRDVGSSGSFPRPNVEIRAFELGLLIVAVVIAAGALRLSSTPPSERPDQAYALLWAVPDRQLASTIHLGVQNMQPTRQDYVLRVEQYDQTLQEYAIQLEPTQTWDADLELPSVVQPGGEVQAVLFRADSPFTPFRQTVIRAAAT